MAGYTPLKIIGNSTGLVQEREEYLLPDDAYPVLQNAYVWRERILRKKGYQLLGRLQRNIGTTDAGGNAVIVIAPLPIQTGVAYFVIGTDIFQDPGTTANPATQTLLTNSSGTGTLNRVTGTLTITGSIPLTDIQYYPGLPVMGLRTREIVTSANNQTIAFDQNYAYVFNSVANQFREFIPGTTWNAHAANTSGTDFFWSTNYWVSSLPIFTTANAKLFWVTNNTGAFGINADPPRITDGVTWVDFFPSAWSQIDATNFLTNWLAMLPFRGRMVVFNTWEGPTAAGSLNYSNRIRWATIGNPFIAYSAGPPARGSWRDDIRGQGGFLDIPTNEDIVSVGFVRDNLVIYCEHSTWQLRYTGRSISPFQIEKVNSELGAEGPFSTIQFDTSLMGIGDKGIVDCDSAMSRLVDVKIPDLVFNFRPENEGKVRVQGVRDFINRLAFWTIPLSSEDSIYSVTFPNQRLLHNYENDSWALFNDSLTALGTFQPQRSRTWLNTPIPWIECDFPWISNTSSVPLLVGGNQQGFVELLDQLTVNDVSLFISNITANTTTSTVITSPNHNMLTGFVISIKDIPIGTPFASSLNNPQIGLISAITQANPAQVTSVNHHLSTGDEINITNVVGMTEVNGLNFTITVIDNDNFTLNGINSTSYTPYVSGGEWKSLELNVFGIIVIDSNSFSLGKYNPVSRDFSDDQLDVPTTDYVGGGLIKIRENFSIQSKKFNFLDEGQSIQMGYLDILMSSTAPDQPGAISLNVYLDYNDSEASNTLPKNEINDGTPIANPDTFFNSIIPTTKSPLNGVGGNKFWQRVYCATRANFLTLQYTFSNEQMAGEEQSKNVQIDAQVLWIRKGGRMTQI